MVVGAITPEQKQLAADILFHEIGVKSTCDLQAIFWVNPETMTPDWVIGFDSFLGKTCQIHVVNRNKKYTPKSLIKAVFEYPFCHAGIETLFGIVNSNNKEAMRYDRHLGFKEVNRFEGMHEDGGDIVLFAMKKDECRWIRNKE
jgi:hypothetical protein